MAKPARLNAEGTIYTSDVRRALERGRNEALIDALQEALSAVDLPLQHLAPDKREHIDFAAEQARVIHAEV